MKEEEAFSGHILFLCIYFGLSPAVLTQAKLSL